MKETQKKEPLKHYESSLTTWNKGKLGKYQILRKINKEAFHRATKTIKK